MKSNNSPSPPLSIPFYQVPLLALPIEARNGLYALNACSMPGILYQEKKEILHESIFIVQIARWGN